MRIETRILPIAGLLLCLVINPYSASAQTEQKIIHSPDGWVVKYGVVDGAAAQPDAIVSVLRSVAKNSGDSPLIGKPFRYKGTNTVGIFYVVRDHSARNVPMIGLILSDFNDKKQVETALMYDTAARFPTTLRPMMETVFKEWRPGGAKPANGVLLPMHEVRLPDGTASAKIPNGWQVGPGSHLGTIGILGPHQEFIVLNANMLAQDPRSPSYQTMMRMGMRGAQGIQVVLPYDADWVKVFPNLYVAFAHALRWNPTDLTIDHIAHITGSASQHCVQGSGHVDNGGGPMELNAMFCPEQPSQPQNGIYLIFYFISLIPNNYADRERATAAAIFGSYQWDEAEARRQASAMAAPLIATMAGVYRDHMHALQQFTQSQIDRTRAIGNEVTNRIAEQQRANDQHNQEWRRQHEEIGRYPQGVSDYLLDQSVIQYSDYNGNVYHERVPNSLAYNLVERNSDKVEIIETRDYIPGVDFRK